MASVVINEPELWKYLIILGAEALDFISLPRYLFRARLSLPRPSRRIMVLFADDVGFWSDAALLRDT